MVVVIIILSHHRRQSSSSSSSSSSVTVTVVIVIVVAIVVLHVAIASQRLQALAPPRDVARARRGRVNVRFSARAASGADAAEPPAGDAPTFDDAWKACRLRGTGGVLRRAGRERPCATSSSSSRKLQSARLAFVGSMPPRWGCPARLAEELLQGPPSPPLRNELLAELFSDGDADGGDAVRRRRRRGSASAAGVGSAAAGAPGLETGGDDERGSSASSSAAAPPLGIGAADGHRSSASTAGLPLGSGGHDDDDGPRGCLASAATRLPLASSAAAPPEFGTGGGEKGEHCGSRSRSRRGGASRTRTAGGAEPSSRRWAPPPSPEERRRILFESARESAMEVMAQAIERYPGRILAQQPLLDLTQGDLLQRIVDLLPPRGGGEAYVGSTSDPAWRWEGGWCWRCERDEVRPRMVPTHMIGHSQRGYRRMVVVGSFSDAETARNETAVLRRLQSISGGGRNTDGMPRRGNPSALYSLGTCPRTLMRRPFRSNALTMTPPWRRDMYSSPLP